MPPCPRPNHSGADIVVIILATAEDEHPKLVLQSEGEHIMDIITVVSIVDQVCAFQCRASWV